MAKEPLHNLPVRLSNANYAVLKEMAFAFDVSMNCFINSLIVNFYDNRFIGREHEFEANLKRKQEIELELEMLKNTSIW